MNGRDGLSVSRMDEELRDRAILAWSLFGIGPLSAFFGFILVLFIILYNLGDARRTRYESHFVALLCGWVICFFSYGLSILLIMTFAAFLGMPLLLLTWICSLLPAVIGLRRAFSRRSFG
jgi:uncharacterized membrane protein